MRLAQQRFRRAGRDDAPLLQDVGARGDVERHRDVLLDQQHGHALGIDPPDDLEELQHDDRREAERRLVEQQQPRAAISARAIATICCWPPESVPAARSNQPESGGNIAATRSSDARRAAFASAR